MEIFPLEYGFGDFFSFEDLFVEIFPLENWDFFMIKTEEDEDGQEMMKIYPWGKNDENNFGWKLMRITG